MGNQARGQISDRPQSEERKGQISGRPQSEEREKHIGDAGVTTIQVWRCPQASDRQLPTSPLWPATPARGQVRLKTLEQGTRDTHNAVYNSPGTRDGLDQKPCRRRVLCPLFTSTENLLNNMTLQVQQSLYRCGEGLNTWKKPWRHALAEKKLGEHRCDSKDQSSRFCLANQHNIPQSAA